MAINIQDRYTQQQVDEERNRRGDKTLVKTARALITERLSQLQNHPSDKERRQRKTAA